MKRIVVTTLFVTVACATVPKVDPQVVVMRGALDTNYLPASATGDVYAHLRIESSELELSERPPINVALVIDTSGSMVGDPITHAKHAALELLAALEPGDRLALVAFHSSVEVIIESTEIDDSMIERLRSKIDLIEASGTTDLVAGLQAGFGQVMAEPFAEGLNTMVLLSDGIPNDATGIVQVARRAQEQGVAIAAFGLGLDYDETTLAAIAQHSGGWFHFIEQPARVAAVFRDEVMRLEQVVGRNAALVLTPGPGVTLDIVGQASQQHGRARTVALGDLEAGHGRDIVLRMRAHGRRTGSTVELVDAQLVFDDGVANIGRLERRVFLAAQSTEDAEQLGYRADDVSLAVEQAMAAASTVQALNLARRGNVAQANRLLNQAKDRAAQAATKFDDEFLSENVANMESLIEATPNMVDPNQQTTERHLIRDSHREAMEVLQGR